LIYLELNIFRLDAEKVSVAGKHDRTHRAAVPVLFDEVAIQRGFQQRNRQFSAIHLTLRRFSIDEINYGSPLLAPSVRCRDENEKDGE
jgi:hypothetical protein